MLTISFIFSGHHDNTGNRITRFFPLFLISYFLIATTNSFHLWPVLVKDVGVELSKIFLITAIVAHGIKTNLSDIMVLGKRPLILLLTTTVFMMFLALAGINFI